MQDGMGLVQNEIPRFHCDIDRNAIVTYCFFFLSHMWFGTVPETHNTHNTQNHMSGHTSVCWLAMTTTSRLNSSENTLQTYQLPPAAFFFIVVEQKKINRLDSW